MESVSSATWSILLHEHAAGPAQTPAAAAATRAGQLRHKSRADGVQPQIEAAAVPSMGRFAWSGTRHQSALSLRTTEARMTITPTATATDMPAPAERSASDRDRRELAALWRHRSDEAARAALVKRFMPL